MAIAWESGELAYDRWCNYLKLQKEARFTARKEGLNLMKKEKFKNKAKSKL